MRGICRSNLLIFMIVASALTLGAESVAAKFGQLAVKAGHIVDKDGRTVQLKGMSTFGLQWYPTIISPDVFDALAKDWKIDVIRLAMYVGEGGYAQRPELKQLVFKGIELAIERGIYVIVDWHVLSPGNPNDVVYAGADSFFDEVSLKFGKSPNVLYEIMNEPNGALDWKRDLKPYAQRIVNVIRKNDPNNVILIGSGTWSQDIDVAAADPVGGNNLAYTFHFYAGTHGKELRDKVSKAMARGVAVFASEWGVSLANGSGGYFLDKSEEWLKFLDANAIGWVNWSLSNKNETSAAFKTGTPLVPDNRTDAGEPFWSPDQLSMGGAWVRAKTRGIQAPESLDAH